MDPQGFANPWEHVRLLSDPTRNAALVALLRRHAPGRRVVEVGCGTGLLSCVAARLGARKVYAVEPTPLWEDAARLVADNGLSDVVEVLPGMVQDLAPREVDVAFSELLNADPFYEGVLDAMDAVAPWVAEGGHLAPRRLRVWAALVRAPGSAREARVARREVRALGAAYDLELGSLLSALECAESYRYHTSTEAPAGPPVLVHDLRLGAGERPAAATRIALTVDDPGPVGGVMVWFEAELDDGLALANEPGQTDHWGQLVCAWADEVGAVPGRPLEVEIRVHDEELDAVRIG